jgi:DNA-binding transcriptional ArsR family regulator
MEAARALSALGHETRLAIFRVLVQAGPGGVSAGEIARMLDLAPNALSFHLKDLTYAGLTESRQHGRYVIYSAVFPVMTGLVDYLTENCCGGLECNVAASPASGRKSFTSNSSRRASVGRKTTANTSRKSMNRSKR